MTTRIIPSSVDFSDRDFDSLRLRLQGLARSVFPDWTDFNIANFGNILLELFAYVGDTLHFYQDNQAGECFIPTLTQRISMIRLGQLIGFSMPTASAATGAVVFSIPRAYTSELTIPRGTRLLTSDPEEPVRFQTLDAGSIPAGSTSSAPIDVEQSEPRSETFYSTGEPNQEVVLTYTPYLDGSIDEAEWEGGNLVAGLSAVNGDFKRVDSLLGYSSTDRVFIVLVDHLDRCHVRFGNGAVGAIPQGEITAVYKTGGGPDGNVEAEKISVIDASLSFGDGSTASVSVANSSATSGGAERMGLDEARVEAPASLRVLNRSVTREDFETVATGVRGVARALMATSNEYAGIPENTGKLYVVAQGAKLSSGRIEPAAPSSALLDQVYDEIINNKPPTITFTFETIACVFKNVSVATRIYLKRGHSGATVAANIRTALKDFFAAQLEDGTNNPDIDFGANLLLQNVNWQGVYEVGAALPTPELAWSDILNVIRDVAGIRKVDEGQQGLLLGTGSQLLRQSVQLLPIEFPKLYSVTITDADTGSAL